MQTPGCEALPHSRTRPRVRSSVDAGRHGHAGSRFLHWGRPIIMAVGVSTASSAVRQATALVGPPIAGVYLP